MRRPLEGKFVLDGSKRSEDWNAFIPDADAVFSKNSPRGFESSANQYPVDETYPYYVTGTQFEAYRNRRINSILRALTKVQPEDMMKLQTDNYNLKAEEVLPLLLSALDTTTLTAGEKNARNTLAKWDYYYNVESEGASL